MLLEILRRAKRRKPLKRRTKIRLRINWHERPARIEPIVKDDDQPRPQLRVNKAKRDRRSSRRTNRVVQYNR